MTEINLPPRRRRHHHVRRDPHGRPLGRQWLEGAPRVRRGRALLDEGPPGEHDHGPQHQGGPLARVGGLDATRADPTGVFVFRDEPAEIALFEEPGPGAAFRLILRAKLAG